MSRGFYTLILRLLLPLALMRLYWRGLRAPAYRQRVAERLTRDRPGPGAAEVWVHAVSVGEVQAAAPLIAHFLKREPPLGVLVTTTTPTGAQRLRALFGDTVTHRYTPYDLPEAVGPFLDRVRPRLALIMETEIWPNALALCAARGIPTILANARLSERSAKGYARLARLAGETLRRLDLIAAQGEADARRFVALGADPARVRVIGNIKLDRHPPENAREQARAMRLVWGPERPVWVAASTHEGEEEPVLQAHRRIRAQIPDALLVLVPRHPERFDRAADLATRAGFPLVRRSAGAPCAGATAVFLGDTMGELQIFLAAADAAFVGGSLVPVGGHNLLEASAVGVPVATGPHVFNFAAIAELLIGAGAAVQVPDAAGLADLMSRWLVDAPLRARIGERGREVVARNRGALGRLIAAIEAHLGGC